MSKSVTALFDIHPNSLVDCIYEALREAILSSHLASGDRLVEAELADRFRTSVTPVREALRRLASHGLVVIKPYTGAFVYSFTHRSVEEIYEIREHLEPLAVCQAVPNLDAQTFNLLETLLTRSDAALAAGDRVELAMSNREFHSTLIQHANNERMIAFLQSLQDQVCLISQMVWAKTHGHTQRLEQDQHSVILQAARSGNAESTSDLVKQHIRDFRQTALGHI